MSQRARFLVPTWGSPGSCCPQAPWTLLSETIYNYQPATSLGKSKCIILGMRRNYPMVVVNRARLWHSSADHQLYGEVANCNAVTAALGYVTRFYFTTTMTNGKLINSPLEIFDPQCNKLSWFGIFAIGNRYIVHKTLLSSQLLVTLVYRSAGSVADILFAAPPQKNKKN